MSQAIRIDFEWIEKGNQHYKGWYIQYNNDNTFTAINNSDTHDYYIRESMAECRAIIDSNS